MMAISKTAQQNHENLFPGLVSTLKQTDPKQSVIDMYRKHNRYMVAGDIDKLGALLADDFHLVHMTGMVQSKQKWLSEIQSGQMHYFSSTEDHIAVTELTAEHAVLVGQSQVDASIHGSRNTWPLQLELHLNKVNGQWLIMHIDASMY
ncbi:nuclear transport factor 2 family protein [Loigolactobacillus backii]|uniref:nuclear transport factor 2 family protein n=2 Tax=Loigolactobacillus backii TaxID=375175 RepID=UPI000AE35230|nr:nuclear transport factor 2 family protein [Loigolactobacillus backii]